MWYNFFSTPKGPSGQKTLFKKSTFCNFLLFILCIALVSILVSALPPLQLLIAQPFAKVGCSLFWPPKGPSGQKTLFKKNTFCNFLPFLGLTPDAIFSVISPCRMLFSTILENYKEKSFQKWFWNLSHVFGSGHKMHFKKPIFDVFCQFFGPTFICNFLSHLLM